MADAHKYSVQEALNIVLNSAEDALKVDIDNVTLKTEGSDINIEVHTDKAEDSMLMFSHTVKTGTGGTSYVPLVDSDGHLQVDIISGTTATTEYSEDAATPSTISGVSIMMERDDALSSLTPAEGDWVALRSSAEGALWTQEFNSDAILADTANMDTNLGTVVGHVDGIEGLLTTIDADTGAIKTAVEIIDNAISGSEMQVDVVTMPSVTVDSEFPAAATAADNFSNPSTTNVMSMGMVYDGSAWDRMLGDSTNGALVNLGSNNDVTVTGTVTANLSATDNAVLDAIDSNTDYGATTGGGAESGALRVTLANDSTGVISVDDGGGALTVDNGGTFAVQSTLQAGSAAIGKLAANSGVDIGDVDVTSNVQPAGFGSIGHGNNTAVGTSAEVLASSQACKHIDVMAAIANTGIIYVGGSGVTAANGIGLYAGDVYSLDIDDVNDVYVVASVNGEDVQYVYYN